MATACPACPCTLTAGGGIHALLRALRADDVDAALSLGLLDAAACTGCADGCNADVARARDERASALAARERHRARAMRLQRRKAEREAARTPAANAASARPALPAAAADALARALARARETRSR